MLHVISDTKGLFTLPDTDLSTDSDSISKPGGHIVLMQSTFTLQRLRLTFLSGLGSSVTTAAVLGTEIHTLIGVLSACPAM